MSSFTVRLDDELTDQLEAMATGMDRSKSYLTALALREFVAREAWFIADVQKGLEQAQRGEFVPEEEMEALFEEFCGSEQPKRGR
jgi:RHH-type transcriptional regulator, rel operon repressor / antitoxin RelB